MSLVGKDIIAECTKCKLSLAHIVIYEVKGQVKKVKCKTCGAEHVYKEEAQGKTGSAAKQPGKEKKVRAARKVSKPVYDAVLDWELKKNEMNHEMSLRDYHMEHTYKPGDVVNHPLFGLGFIREVSGTSMEVLFKDSLKRMAKGFKRYAPPNAKPEEPELRTEAAIS